MSDDTTRPLWDLQVPMRDGVELSADVYFPPPGTDGPFPTLLHRTPYNNQFHLYTPQAKAFAAKGYAVVLQDIRGRHDSDGDFYPFHNEGPDGYDTIEWIAEQNWCNGKVGMFGGSYGGWVQWAAAREQPPHLTALVSSCAAGRWMEEVPYRGGMVSLTMFTWLNFVSGRVAQDNARVDWQHVLRHLPLRTMDKTLGREIPAWQDWLDHPQIDEYWDRIRFTPEDFARIDLPVLHLTGWYDGDQPGQLFFYRGMMEHSPAADRQHLTIGPWDHAGVRFPQKTLGGVEFSADAVVPMDDVHLAWYDRWMRDDEATLPDSGPCRYYVMGSDSWIDTSSWPPSAEQRTFYLRAGGRLATEAPDDQEDPDSYDYDPEDPVVASMEMRFYANFFNPDLRLVAQPMDRRFIERRDDVLTYSSEPLTEPLTIVGQTVVRLFASSDRPDTDWVVALTDVEPKGRSIPLASGQLRARYRNTLRVPELMEPGSVYLFEIELTAVAHTFREGHRIRLSVTSSNFPFYDRNLNTGGPTADDIDPAVAHNKVYHVPASPSVVVLPVSKP